MNAAAMQRIKRYFQQIGEVRGEKSRRGSLALNAMGLLGDGERKRVEPLAARRRLPGRPTCRPQRACHPLAPLPLPEFYAVRFGSPVRHQYLASPLHHCGTMVPPGECWSPETVPITISKPWQQPAHRTSWPQPVPTPRTSRNRGPRKVSHVARAERAPVHGMVIFFTSGTGSLGGTVTVRLPSGQSNTQPLGVSAPPEPGAIATWQAAAGVGLQASLEGGRGGPHPGHRVLRHRRGSHHREVRFLIRRRCEWRRP